MRNYDNIMLHTLSKTKHSQPDFSIFTYWRNGIVFLDPQKRVVFSFHGSYFRQPSSLISFDKYTKDISLWDASFDCKLLLIKYERLY